MADEEKKPIIIKKIKKGGHGGHHGGAWKVAYADFVTAMMAFFLLMWLLNSTTEEERRGISNYFGPSGNLLGSGGTGGILGGQSIEAEGSFDSANSEGNVMTEAEQDGPDGFPLQAGQAKDETEAKAGETKNKKEQNIQEAKKIIQEQENKMFKDVEDVIRQTIQDTPDLKKLAENLIIEQTPEGLRIQIIDKDKYSMFPNGKAQMYDYTQKLLAKVATVIKKLPNKISISGHTDAKPFASHSDYTNWELSTDRANATRRELLRNGIPEDHIFRVVGKAAQEPIIPNDPKNDRNRRISITLLRSNGPVAKGAGSS